MSVLVVDDSPLNRVVLARLCAAAGATCVVEAANGREALLQYQAGGPAGFSLIFMDIRMPVMDGWQATSQIRSLEQAAGWPPVPVVACTTEDLSTRSANLQRCWDCGMNAATGKPISKDVVAQLIERWAGCGGSPRVVAAALPAVGSRTSTDSDSSAICSSLLTSGAISSPLAAAAAEAAVDADAGADLSTCAAAPSSRSSMDWEVGHLATRVQQALQSSFYT